jgi:hypothetical protein
VIENKESDYLQGQNNHPRTVNAAFTLLVNWKQGSRNIMPTVGVNNDGVAFTNMECTSNEEYDDKQGITLSYTGGSCAGITLKSSSRAVVTTDIMLMSVPILIQCVQLWTKQRMTQ